VGEGGGFVFLSLPIERDEVIGGTRGEFTGGSEWGWGKRGEGGGGGGRV